MKTLKFKINEKVSLISKSVGRSFREAHYPDIGWIRKYDKYYIISYSESGNGDDFYLEGDLRKINCLPDDLFEI